MCNKLHKFDLSVLISFFPYHLSFSDILIFKPKIHCHFFYCRKLESSLTLLSNKFACFSSGINTQCASLHDVSLCRRVGHLFSALAMANCSSWNSWVWNVKLFWDRTRWVLLPPPLLFIVYVYTQGLLLGQQGLCPQVACGRAIHDLAHAFFVDYYIPACYFFFF